MTIGSLKSEYAYSSTRGKAQQAKGPVATPRRRAVENQSTGGFHSTEPPCGISYTRRNIKNAMERKLHFIVGSENKAKVNAVSEVLTEYPHLSGARVDGVRTGSGVADQPMSLDATVSGAMKRARSAFGACDYSVGVEAGR